MLRQDGVPKSSLAPRKQDWRRVRSGLFWDVLGMNAIYWSCGNPRIKSIPTYRNVRQHCYCYVQWRWMWHNIAIHGSDTIWDSIVWSVSCALASISIQSHWTQKPQKLSSFSPSFRSPAILAGGEFPICQLQTHVAGFGGRGALREHFQLWWLVWWTKDWRIFNYYGY